MIYWTVKFPKYIQDIDIFKINLNTLMLVGLASAFIVTISLFINYGSRISKSKILNYQGTPELTVGVFDSVICAAIFVSILVTSSVPSAALAHAIALSFVISA